MKTISATLAFLALLSWGTACQAGIIGATAAADGDGAIVCTGTWTANPLWTPEVALTDDAGEMVIVGQQYGPVGHVGTEDLDETASFTVDGDPIAKLRTTIENDTGFAWTGYHVDVYMDHPFTLSAPTIYTPGDWTVGSYAGTAIQVQVAPDKYLVSLDFIGGTPVPSGTGENNETDPGTLDFSYKLQFTGSVNYCQQMTPVPEPASLALVLSGLVGLLVVRRKFAR